ncbi:hypothetical protein [Acinetobacter rongchengensis]|uniref:Uncharacterized protein n=1 Tax=Acinetobacter rongchengensis TaxID=2419601 RepID=A0A3A8ESC4_9GAMM|nr:hypothetical protein [Acinetobacter rongchengensis]RKG37747.1 hypothetical protein D7V20_10045 [Acinetobacter rongchengensis]
MIFIITGIVFLYLAVIFIIWQTGKLSKENQTLLSIQQDQEQHINAQEQHLKQTLQIMQDLAKKMHVQQEVIDKTTARMAQVELQNAELIRLLQQNLSSK